MKYLICLGCFFAQILSAQSLITGSLMGYDGKPMKMSHVHLLKDSGFNAPAIQSVQTKANGSFELPIPASHSDILTLQFTGVDHTSFTTKVYLEGQDSIKLNIQLIPYSYNTQLDEVAILTAETNFALGASRPFTKLSDGTFAADFEAKADTFAYQLSGLEAERRTINGTQSDYFVYDGGGDYRSVLKVKKGQHFAVSFDPKKLIKNDQLPKVEVIQPQSHSARINDAYFFSQTMRADFDHEQNKLTQADVKLMMQRAKSGNMRDTTGNRQMNRDRYRFMSQYDWKPYYAQMEQRIGSETDSLIKSVLLIGYSNFMGRGKKPMNYKTILTNVPPSSGVWALLSERIVILKTSLDRKYPNESSAYFTKFLAENKDNEARLWLLQLGTMQPMMRKDSTAVKAIWEQMKAIDPNSTLTRSAEVAFDMARGRMPSMKPPSSASSAWKNKPFPTFSFPSFDDPSKQVSSEALRGKYVLVDFWAVWCSPCIEEMKNIHAVYDQFKNNNIVFVSISFDEGDAEIREFRKNRYSMPWQNIWIKDSFKDVWVKSLGINSIPAPFLIDPMGIVIADGAELRGTNLTETLNKFLH